MTDNLTVIAEEEYQDPLSVFMYSLKAAETRRQWPGRLKIFLDFLKLDGTTMGEKAKQFTIKARQDPQWAQENLMKFIAFQIERARRNEISETTISNYYKAAKLFCEMNDLTVLSLRLGHCICISYNKCLTILLAYYGA